MICFSVAGCASRLELIPLRQAAHTNLRASTETSVQYSMKGSTKEDDTILGAIIAILNLKLWGKQKEDDTISRS
jgi:hypothetical protein